MAPLWTITSGGAGYARRPCARRAVTGSATATTTIPRSTKSIGSGRPPTRPGAPCCWRQCASWPRNTGPGYRWWYVRRRGGSRTSVGSPSCPSLLVCSVYGSGRQTCSQGARHRLWARPPRGRAHERLAGCHLSRLPAPRPALLLPPLPSSHHRQLHPYPAIRRLATRRVRPRLRSIVSRTSPSFGIPGPLSPAEVPPLRATGARSRACVQGLPLASP